MEQSAHLIINKMRDIISDNDWLIRCQLPIAVFIPWIRKSSPTFCQLHQCVLSLLILGYIYSPKTYLRWFHIFLKYYGAKGLFDLTNPHLHIAM